MEASLWSYCKKLKVKNSTKPCYFKRILFLRPQCLPAAPKAPIPMPDTRQVWFTKSKPLFHGCPKSGIVFLDLFTRIRF